MKITKFLCAGALFALAPMAVTPVAAQQDRDEQRSSSSSHHNDHNNNGAGFIAGAIIGGVIAGAIASGHNDDDDDWRNDDGYYNNHHPNYGGTFRPNGTKHTICYRARRVCYTKGRYSEKWTRREFGYYGRSSNSSGRR